MLADTIAPFSTTTPQTAIYYWADFYQVNRAELYDTLQCESRFDPAAKGDKIAGIYTSFGIAQFHNPEKDWGITKAQAYDPDFSIRLMAKSFHDGKQGRWSCWTQKYGKSD